MLKHTPIDLDAIDAKIKKSGRGQHLHTLETLQRNKIPKYVPNPEPPPEPETPHPGETDISANLKKVLDTRARVREKVRGEIIFSEPILRQGTNPVIFPRTINVIQGQAGVHKSRIAATICAALMKRPGHTDTLLGYNRTDENTQHAVCYVDTERNLSEQFPHAMQTLKMQAGYYRSDEPEIFDFISLLQIPRAERFNTLDEYLKHLNRTTTNPLLVVLDVSTDCIEDFNKTDKSMQLIDLMNIAIDTHDITFLCLIHENPKSDKARGHFGTELMNKSTTLMQVGFEKDSSQNDTDLIRVKYLKTRSTGKPTPFYVKYDNEVNKLVLASPDDVSTVVNARKKKAGNDDIIEHLEMYLGDGAKMVRTDLIDKLCADFKSSVRTIEERLKDIIDSESTMYNAKAEICTLHKDTPEGEKKMYYSIKKLY